MVPLGKADFVLHLLGERCRTVVLQGTSATQIRSHVSHRVGIESLRAPLLILHRARMKHARRRNIGAATHANSKQRQPQTRIRHRQAECPHQRAPTFERARNDRRKKGPRIIGASLRTKKPKSDDQAFDFEQIAIAVLPLLADRGWPRQLVVCSPEGTRGFSGRFGPTERSQDTSCCFATPTSKLSVPPRSFRSRRIRLVTANKHQAQRQRMRHAFQSHPIPPATRRPTHGRVVHRMEMRADRFARRQR
jgi:hypothetical protein